MESASVRYTQEMNRGDGSIPLEHVEVKTSLEVNKGKQPSSLWGSSFPEESYVHTK
jgi:hypothetical protein